MQSFCLCLPCSLQLPFGFTLGLWSIVAYSASFVSLESLPASTSLRLLVVSTAFLYAFSGCLQKHIPTLQISTLLLCDTLVKSEVKRTWRENPSSQFNILVTSVSHDSAITNGLFDVTIGNNPTDFNSEHRYKALFISF